MEYEVIPKDSRLEFPKTVLLKLEWFLLGNTKEDFLNEFKINIIEKKLQKVVARS